MTTHTSIIFLKYKLSLLLKIVLALKLHNYFCILMHLVNTLCNNFTILIANPETLALYVLHTCIIFHK